MPKKNQGMKRSCVTCGTPYQVYPPDSLHTRLHLKSDNLKDYIEMTVLCKNPDCDKPEIKLFWEHPEIVARLI